MSFISRFNSKKNTDQLKNTRNFGSVGPVKANTNVLQQQRVNTTTGVGSGSLYVISTEMNDAGNKFKKEVKDSKSGNDLS